jgi:serine/threonine protein kinase
MAMELLKGDDLKKWTPKNNLLPVEKTLEYIAISAEALDYAHKNGVVHRDIKPANIMLLENGELRVADFGIARIQASSKTATGTVLGTPYYMSPEQIAGKKVDGRADLFSLGVTLYELLTGERPWKGGEAVGTLFFQISSDPYPDPLLVRPDLPKGIVPVIDKALKKNPDERYQNGAEMAADLRRLSNKPAAPPPAPTAPKQGTKTPQPAPVPAAKVPTPQATLVVKPVPQAQPAVKPAPQSAPPAAIPKPAAPRPMSAPPAPETAAGTGPGVSFQTVKIEPHPLPAPARPAPAQPARAEAPAPSHAALNKLELEPPPATLSLSPKKAAELKTAAPAPAPLPDPALKDGIQRPMSEALGQAAAPRPAADRPAQETPQPRNQPPQTGPKPAPLSSNAPDFEKTLPLIYPEEEKR